MKKGCPYGTHRVLSPPGSLPQAALKLDNSMAIWDNELLLDVDTLNIDSASFSQISGQAEGAADRIAAAMLEIVAERGKHHNPVTGSGGMFIGRVRDVGPKHPDSTVLRPGSPIVSLVSLTLTPLQIDAIHAVHRDTAQVDVTGQAVLFASGIYAVLPDDLPAKVALAALDVAGAPAQTAKLVKPGDTVLIIGAGGKSGCLCLHEAKKRAGISGKVLAMDYSDTALDRLAKLDLADAIIQADAADPLRALEEYRRHSGGTLADITINCVNLPHTEMAAILCTRDGGVVYFFSMATSFTAAALGAEGVGRDVTMLIGNGYSHHHADIALHVLRENVKLRELFAATFV